VESLVEVFRGLPSAGEVLVPLSVGGHVDHRLVRRAAEICFEERLRYYEDFPYAGRWLSVWKCTRPKRAWQAEICALDAPALEIKLRALEKYASQFEILFGVGGQAAMTAQVKRYARRAGGERFWSRKTSA